MSYEDSYQAAERACREFFTTLHHEHKSFIQCCDRAHAFALKKAKHAQRYRVGFTTYFLGMSAWCAWDWFAGRQPWFNGCLLFLYSALAMFFALVFTKLQRGWLATAAAWLETRQQLIDNPPPPSPV